MVEAKAIAIQIASKHPFLGSVGALIVKKPVGIVLLGLCLETSKYTSTSFYVSWVVIPLCSPTKSLYFQNFGNLNISPYHTWRLAPPSGGSWDLSDTKNIEELNYRVETQIYPVWQKLEKIDHLIAFLESTQAYNNDQRLGILECIIYLAFMKGDKLQCLANIQKFRLTVDSCRNMMVSQMYANEYYTAMRKRVDTVSDLIEEGDDESIGQLIKEWTKFSVANLKIGKFVQ